MVALDLSRVLSTTGGCVTLLARIDVGAAVAVACWRGYILASDTSAGITCFHVSDTSDVVSVVWSSHALHTQPARYLATTAEVGGALSTAPRGTAVSGGDDGSVVAWDVVTGAVRWRYDAPREVVALQLAPVSSPLVPGAVWVLGDGTVRVALVELGDTGPAGDARGGTDASTGSGGAGCHALAQWNVQDMRNSCLSGVGNVLVAASHQSRGITAYVLCTRARVPWGLADRWLHGVCTCVHSCPHSSRVHVLIMCTGTWWSGAYR